MNYQLIKDLQIKIIGLMIQWKMLELQKYMATLQTENGKKLLAFCLANEGTSFGNQYVDVGCAEEVNAVMSVALGFQIGGGASTYLMYQALQDKKRFKKSPLTTLVGGEIIISPSGYGNGNLKNGHVGTYVGNGEIMSNNSKTGRLEKTHTLDKWKEKYVIIGGYPMEAYRVL